MMWSLPSYDLDIAPRQSNANLLRLTHALVDVEAEVMGSGRVRSFPLDDWLRASKCWNFATSLGRLDVLMQLDGVTDYEELAREATPVMLSPGLSVLVASVRHLIAMKEAAGRSKDEPVLQDLYWLRDRPQGPPPPVEP